MDPQDIISSGILEIYVTGAATKEEVVQVLAWRKEFPEVAAELNDLEIRFEQYAIAHAVQPPASLKQKIQAHAGVTPTEINTTTGKTISMRPWRFAAAAAILLLIGSAVLNIHYYNKYSEADKKFQSSEERFASLNNHVTELD